MARRKKRGIRGTRPESRKKGRDLFNPVFVDPGPVRLRPEQGPVDHPPEAAPGTKPGDEEMQLFLDAMSGVEPLSSDKTRVTPVPDPRIRPHHPAPDAELEVMSHLADLVTGVAEMDITFSDEYIEGCVPGFNPRLMKRLKRAEFPIQAHLDLHGLTQQAAEAEVRGFLLQSYRQGLRCVLVVHGRGLNSENQIPVLKERLPVWLSRGPAKKIVLAFSTARPYDGGMGALYVLLRKRRGAL